MPLTADPAPRDTDQPDTDHAIRRRSQLIGRVLDALFREARRLERRRRNRHAALVVLACGAIAAILLATINGGSGPSSVSGQPSGGSTAFHPRSVVRGDFARAFIALALSPIGSHGVWAGNGGVIERSDDGGRRWLDITPENLVGDDPAVRIAGFASHGPDDVWLAATEAGDATPEHLRGFAIEHSSDGGRTWRWTGIASCGGCSSMSFSFVTAQHGWALAGNGALYETIDGGTHWSTVGQAPRAQRAAPAAIDFTSSTTGWLTSGRSLYGTHDSGRHWRAVELPAAVTTAATAPRLDAPHFFDARTGIVPAAISDRRAVIYRTADAGRHWSVLTLPGPLVVGGQNWAPPALTITSATTWSLASGESLYITVNSGRSWTRVPTPRTYRLGVAPPIWGAAMTTPTTGWLDAVVDPCGHSGPTARNRRCNLPMLLETSDAGTHWTVISEPAQ